MCLNKTTENRDMRYSGKKCYVLSPILVKLKQPPLKLPDYRGEEYFGGMEFD